MTDRPPMCGEWEKTGVVHSGIGTRRVKAKELLTYRKCGADWWTGKPYECLRPSGPQSDDPS